jgi:hypothetical protein
MMLVEDLDSAKLLLAERECRNHDGTPALEERAHRFSREFIGYWSGNDARGNCADTIGEWAQRKQLEGVVWTDLPPKFNGTNGVVPTADQVISLLEELSANGRQAEAENYIRRAPSQIATDYRARIEHRFQWIAR